MSRHVRSGFVFLVAALLVAGSVPLLAADGGALYKAKCAACHGADGSGNTPVGKNLKVKSLSSAEVQKQSDADLEKTISKGKGKMPAFAGKLSAEELKAVVECIRGFAKK